MKQTAILLCTLCAFIPSYATMPDYLSQYAVNDGDQMTIFNAMDSIENRYPDSMDKITYDAYPDGRRTISRMMTANMSPSGPCSHLYQTFDSLLNVPNPERFAFKKDDMIIFQFGVNTANNRLVFDFSANDPTSMTNVSAINSGANSCAQSWTINTDQPVAEGNFTPIINQFDKISQKRYTLTQNVSFPIPTSQGGALRLRDNNTSVGNNVTGRRVIDSKTMATEWIKTYDLFMEHFGTNENISITYYRSKRMVTLIDYSTHTIYAACFKAESAFRTGVGTLIILIAEYSGAYPYLPSNWTTAN